MQRETPALGGVLQLAPINSISNKNFNNDMTDIFDVDYFCFFNAIQLVSCN